MFRANAVLAIFAFFIISSYPGIASALDQKEAQVAIETFLATQRTQELEPQTQEHIVADLNSDGAQEIVLLWLLLGPTFSYTKLTVLSQTANGYAPAASVDITGLAERLTVEDGTIIVDTLVLGENDPRCCPSVKKRVKYRWTGQNLSEQ